MTLEGRFFLVSDRFFSLTCTKAGVPDRPLHGPVQQTLGLTALLLPSLTPWGYRRPELRTGSEGGADRVSLIGLVRVSSDDQDTARQRGALAPLCSAVFDEQNSRRTRIERRPEMLAALASMVPGDRLVVTRVEEAGTERHRRHRRPERPARARLRRHGARGRRSRRPRRGVGRRRPGTRHRASAPQAPRRSGQSGSGSRAGARGCRRSTSGGRRKNADRDPRASRGGLDDPIHRTIDRSLRGHRAQGSHRTGGTAGSASKARVRDDAF
jgi:hypothetical protein